MDCFVNPYILVLHTKTVGGVISLNASPPAKEVAIFPASMLQVLLQKIQHLTF
ncbi:hypothetical protein J7J00_06855 [Bacillus sp. ISL-4]|nr:hypothetical protein [Bacillus sp. ISL-4]